MLYVPSGFLYQPSNAGVTVWPEALIGASGNCARAGNGATTATSMTRRPSNQRVGRTAIVLSLLPRFFNLVDLPQLATPRSPPPPFSPPGAAHCLLPPRRRTTLRI